MTRFALALTLGLLVPASFALPTGAQDKAESQRPFAAFDKLLARPFVDQVTREQFRVPPGSDQEAWDYYGQIAPELGLVDGEVPPTLDALLEYFGYRGLKASDAQFLPSDVLMDFSRLAKQVSNPHDFAAAFGAKPIEAKQLLAVRYFAPKTTDVTVREPPGPLSWRKLVRLRARPSSLAHRSGVSALYWLSVTYVPLSGQDPFTGFAKNNQVILDRDDLADQNRRGAYWLVYGPLTKDGKGGRLMSHTETSWDAVHPETQNRAGLRRYHVPEACQYCHGYSKKRPKLAYLDTDHWLDRIQPGDDFNRLQGQPWAVLFDAGSDPATDQYARAFDVIRQVNTEIAAQNAAVNPRAFETRAAEHWLALHQDRSTHVPALERGIPGPGGSAWDPQFKTDSELLPLLNRYCYRCHSSLYYHVFDKSEVLKMARMTMLERVRSSDPEYRMPQDRVLPDDVKQQFQRLLEDLVRENPE